MKLAARLHLVSLLPALILLAGFGILAPPQARAQNVNSYYSTVAWTVTYVSGQTVLTPVPNATVQVCYYPANAVPCTNLAQLYLGPTILGGTGPNPISTDAYGNLGFWTAAGYYQYTLTNSLGQSIGPYTVVLGGSGGGGGGATFPNTNGIVYNTSTTTATNATSQQIVTALNTAPSTTLTNLLLPVATTVSLGQVQPDGTTITITSGGVISSTSSGGIIPNTTLVLKGGGAVGLSVAATPGTDYVVPSGSITGTAGNLSGTPTLPNGVSAVTQATGPCDSSTRIATDAFVVTCGSGGGGGGGAFSAITTGVNTAATMTLGTGSSLTFSGSGTVNASSVNSNTFPASGGLLSGGVLYASSASAVSTSAALAHFALVVGGGVGAAPSTIASTGTSGQALLSGGASANPAYGLLALTALATQSSNTVLGNSTGSVASPTALSVPSCSASNDALIWTSGTGFGCNTITTSSASIVASEESVAFSTTPTFSVGYRESTITITANVTSFTLAAGAAGQEKTLTFCQNSTGGYTVAAPSNVHGFMSVGSSPSKCNSQHYTYNSIQTAWIADSPGVINE